MPSKVNQVDWSLVVPGTSSCKFGLSYSDLPPSYSIAEKQENHSCTLASLSNGHYLSSPPPPTCLHTILLLLLLLLLPFSPLLLHQTPASTSISLFTDIHVCFLFIGYSYFCFFRSFKILCCLSIKESTNDHQITPQEPSTPTKDNLRVVLAAGGTGGHIIPAVAIADELRVSNPNIEILFIGAPNSMESTSISSAGYSFTSIPPVRLFRPLFSLENLSLPIHLVHSIIHSFKLLKEFDPHIVIGTGGYVSFPTCLAALFKRTKIVIHEQNSVPGIANYVLSYFSQLVFLSFNSTIECFPKKHNCVVTGNPVRVSLRKFVSKAVARLEFFPVVGEEAKVILVLGGSLGANAINIALLNVYSQMLLEHKDWYIIWQTGVESYNEMESLVKNHSNLVLIP